jgi:hypothetical protein
MAVVAGIVACNVVLSGFRQRYCPPRLLGRVVATTMFLNHSTIPLGALLAGTLGATIGPRNTMWIMACLLALCWLILTAGPIHREQDLPTSTNPTHSERTPPVTHGSGPLRESSPEQA